MHSLHKLFVLPVCWLLGGQPFMAGAETVALWLFDDPLGSTTAVDSSGHGYHLTLGADAAIVADGKYGSALNPDALAEDGLGAYRYKAEAPLNPDDEDWTLECWLRASSAMSGDNRVWGLSGVNYIDYGRGDRLTGLYVASRFLPIDGVNGWHKPTGNLRADDQYHHFAVVYDAPARQLRHYFDGQLQFVAHGVWRNVAVGEPPYRDAVFPPHYPMLQVGMRDAYQQWDHRELHASGRQMKKFEGNIDEMRFSDEALYRDGFTPPGSFARPCLRVWPEQLSLVAVKAMPAATTGRLLVSASRTATRWTIDEQIPWLSVNPAAGESTAGPVEVTVSVETGRLQPGRYRGVIHVRAARLGRVAVPAVLTVADTVRQVSTRKQLFIDKRFVAASENVRWRIHPPEKVPIDFPNAHYPRNIIYDQERGVWRMYFAPWSNLEHAESTDGLHWRRPGPGHIGYESEKDPGKLLPLNFGAVVMVDPVDVPQRRYKAFQEVTPAILAANGYEVGRRDVAKDKRSLVGVYAFYSADGFRFKKAGRVLPILPEFSSPAPCWDPNIGKYVVWFRVQNTKLKGLASIQGNQFFYRYGFSYDTPEGFVESVAPDTMAAAGYENLRSVGRIETDDLLKPWPVSATAERDTLYATANQVPMVLHADRWDGFADFYTSAPLVYPYAEDVYLMFPTFFRHFHPSRQPWFHRFDDANGPLETVIAVSRDGSHWQRLDRAAYIPMGRNDQNDRLRTMVGVGMVRAGNDLYQYYWYTGDLHDSVSLRPDMKKDPSWSSGLMAVRQRLDGFVSVDADYRGGWITTPPLVFSGSRLRLNQACGAQGTIFVELRDLNDRPIPGHTLGDCEEICCNDVAWEVRWQGSGDLTALAGKPIKIYFKMVSAKLYAFQFTR